MICKNQNNFLPFSITTKKQSLFNERLKRLSEQIDAVVGYIPELKKLSADKVRSYCTDNLGQIRDKINDCNKKFKELEEEPDGDTAEIKKALKQLNQLKQREKALEEELNSIIKALPDDNTKLNHKEAKNYFTDKFLKHHVRGHDVAEKEALRVWKSRVSLAKHFTDLEKSIRKVIAAAEMVKVSPTPDSLNQLKDMKANLNALSEPETVESEEKIQESDELVKKASDLLDTLKVQLNALVEKAPDKSKRGALAKFEKLLNKKAQTKDARKHTKNKKFVSTVIALSEQEIISIATDLKRKLAAGTVNPDRGIYETKNKYAHWSIGGKTVNVRKQPKPKMKPLKCKLENGRINHYGD